MVRVVVYLVCWLAGAGLAAAQGLIPSDRLTLPEALDLAVERNPRLAVARSGVAIREADRIDASRRLNPSLTLESENYPLFDPRRPSFSDGQQLTVRVDQAFEPLGRRRLRTIAAEEAVAVAAARVADERRRLEFDVRRAYLAVVLAKADMEVADTTLEEIGRVIDINRARFDQGEISGGEVRRVQVERLKFADDLFNADLALRNARSALLALLNAPDLGEDFDVTETLFTDDVPAARSASAAPGPQALIARALTRRPDLIAAQRDTDRAGAEARHQRALRIPAFAIGGGYQRVLGSDAVVFGVTLPLPLANRNEGGIARATAELRQAEQAADVTSTMVRLEVQQALNTVDIARARVAYIEQEYLTPARESRDIVLAAYQLGTVDVSDYLDAQRVFRDTLRTYNRALYERRLSLFQLAAATAAADETEVGR